MKKNRTIKGVKTLSVGGNCSLQKVLRMLCWTVFFLTLSLVQVTASNSYAQQAKSVTGKVTEESGQALHGVTVLVKGTTNGTITDADGVYTISSVPADAVLVFSFIGMKTQEIAVGDQTQINVVMRISTIEIEEVVAIGYGTVTKKEVTGSVATLNTKDFNKGDMTNPMSLIQGKVL